MADATIRKRRSDIKDITGEHFGLWTVLYFDITPVGQGAFWICQCACGTIASNKGTVLRKLTTLSCGCDSARRIGEANTTHGHTNTPEYRIWSSIKSRCTRSGHVAFDRYNGRGIYLCKGWTASFSNFIADMGRITPGCVSIDRIDNDGPYTCGHCDDCISKGAVANCQWATAQQQARNRRNNRYLTHNGVTKLLVEWADEFGIMEGTLRERLRHGWSVEDALTTPTRTKRTNPEPTH